MFVQAEVLNLSQATLPTAGHRQLPIVCYVPYFSVSFSRACTRKKKPETLLSESPFVCLADPLCSAGAYRILKTATCFTSSCVRASPTCACAKRCACMAGRQGVAVLSARGRRSVGRMCRVGAACMCTCIYPGVRTLSFVCEPTAESSCICYCPYCINCNNFLCVEDELVHNLGWCRPLDGESLSSSSMRSRASSCPRMAILHWMWVLWVV